MTKMEAEVVSAWWLRPAIALYSVVVPALVALRIMRPSTAFCGVLWTIDRGVRVEGEDWS